MTSAGRRRASALAVGGDLDEVAALLDPEVVVVGLDRDLDRPGRTFHDLDPSGLDADVDLGVVPDGEGLMDHRSMVVRTLVLPTFRVARV